MLVSTFDFSVPSAADHSPVSFLSGGASPAWPHRLPVPADGFDLESTLECGQVFHWWKDAHGVWHGLMDRTLCAIYIQGDTIFTTAPPDKVTSYFRLDDPLEEILRTFPKSAYARDAQITCAGMRLIRQPFWECLASFLCSSMKQVAHIRKITNSLRERFGECLGGTGNKYPNKLYAFPTADVLAKLSEATLRSCGLGYRAQALLGTAQRIADGEVSEAMLRALPTHRARELLQTLPGVGPKIANCVLLFSLDRLEAVPVDVWVARILQAMAHRKLTAREMENRARRLGPYAGYVQQYFFHHARVHRRLPTSAR